MLRINEPEVSRKEFDAVKAMAKENFNYDFYLSGLLFIWPVLMLIGLVDGFLTLFVAGSVILSGLGFFFCIFKLTPARYKILYKKKCSCSSKR